MLYSTSLVQIVLKAEACKLQWEAKMIQADDVESFADNLFKRVRAYYEREYSLAFHLARLV